MKKEFKKFIENLLKTEAHAFDGKFVHISKKDYAKVHKDYKSKIGGKEMMLVNDPKTGGTVLAPVKFTEAFIHSDRNIINKPVKYLDYTFYPTSYKFKRNAVPKAGQKIFTREHDGYVYDGFYDMMKRYGADKSDVFFVKEKNVYVYPTNAALFKWEGDAV